MMNSSVHSRFETQPTSSTKYPLRYFALHPTYYIDLIFQLQLAARWSQQLDDSSSEEVEIEVTNWAGRFA